MHNKAISIGSRGPNSAAGQMDVICHALASALALSLEAVRLSHRLLMRRKPFKRAATAPKDGKARRPSCERPEASITSLLEANSR